MGAFSQCRKGRSFGNNVNSTTILLSTSNTRVHHKYHIHQCYRRLTTLCAMQVQFSPDGRWIVSASFDKAVKLWDGIKGTFITTFRGHVRPVYQVSWSSDSRLVVSGSSDSTLKVNCFNIAHSTSSISLLPGTLLQGNVLFLLRLPAFLS